MDNYNNYINRIWHDYMAMMMRPNTNHIFINDMNHVDKLESDNLPPLMNNNPKPEYPELNQYFKFIKHMPIPKEILPMELIEDIHMTLNGSDPSWSMLESKLEKFSDYLLVTNTSVPKINLMFQNKSTNTLNVCIMGGGPTGLYIANYMKLAGPMFPKINLAIIDNRIPKGKEGFRMPYTRNRIFGFDPSVFSSFIPMFPCIRGLIERKFIKIKYLENILMVFIYKLNIPIYFTDKINNESALKKFILKNNIDIVFDCTGDRLGVDYATKLKSDFFPPNTIYDNDKYHIAKTNSEYKLEWKNNIHNRFYLSMEIYDVSGKYISTPMVTETLLFDFDIIFLSNLHNKYVQINPSELSNTIGIFDNLRDMGLAKKIQDILIMDRSQIIKFYILEPKIYHKISISKIIKQSSLNTIIIGAGDTIFSSHFVIGAGLGRLLRFTDNIIWYIQTLY